MKGIPIKECGECPHKVATNFYSTDGWDSMEDWECKLLPGDTDGNEHKKIQGAVEWHDKVCQPDWCPLSEIKEQN